MKRLLPLLALLASIPAFGQATRVDIPIQTSGPNVPVIGGPLPQALWAANATVTVCTHVQPASSQSFSHCQSTPLTTYTDSGEGTTCTAPNLLVQLPGTTCTSSAGTAANLGMWYGGGLFDYYVSVSYGIFGPYTASSANPATGSPCATALSVQLANGSSSAFTCDANFIVNTATHVLGGYGSAGQISIPMIGSQYYVDPGTSNYNLNAAANACANAQAALVQNGASVGACTINARGSGAIGRATATATVSGGVITGVTAGQCPINPATGKGYYLSSWPPHVYMGASSTGVFGYITATVSSSTGCPSYTVQNGGSGFTTAPILTVQAPADIGGTFDMNVYCNGQSTNACSVQSAATCAAASAPAYCVPIPTRIELGNYIDYSMSQIPVRHGLQIIGSHGTSIFGTTIHDDSDAPVFYLPQDSKLYQGDDFEDFFLVPFEGPITTASIGFDMDCGSETYGGWEMSTMKSLIIGLGYYGFPGGNEILRCSNSTAAAVIQYIDHYDVQRLRMPGQSSSNEDFVIQGDVGQITDQGNFRNDAGQLYYGGSYPTACDTSGVPNILIGGNNSTSGNALAPYSINFRDGAVQYGSTLFEVTSGFDINVDNVHMEGCNSAPTNNGVLIGDDVYNHVRQIRFRDNYFAGNIGITATTGYIFNTQAASVALNLQVTGNTFGGTPTWCVLGANPNHSATISWYNNLYVGTTQCQFQGVTPLISNTSNTLNIENFRSFAIGGTTRITNITSQDGPGDHVDGRANTNQTFVLSSVATLSSSSVTCTLDGSSKEYCTFAIASNSLMPGGTFDPNWPVAFAGFTGSLAPLVGVSGLTVSPAVSGGPAAPSSTQFSVYTTALSTGSYTDSGSVSLVSNMEFPGVASFVVQAGQHIGLSMSDLVNPNVWSIRYSPPLLNVASNGGDVACAVANDQTIAQRTITGGSSTSSTITITGASGFAAGYRVGQIINVNGVTPSGYNTVSGTGAVITAISGSTGITYASTNNPGAWSSGGTVSMFCSNQTNDALSATQFNFATVQPTPAGFLASTPYARYEALFGVFTPASNAPTIQMTLNYGATNVWRNTAAIQLTSGMTSEQGGSIAWSVFPTSTTAAFVEQTGVAFPTSSALNAFGNSSAVIQPQVGLGTGASYFSLFTYFGATGVASGTYTSGGTITGSATQTCTLTSFNDSSTATATVALTGTNTIAGGTALTITSRGGGATAAPTTATLGNGTATCSGTATISTVLGGSPGNALILNSFTRTQ